MLKPVCYAILGKSGMWMSESCICEDADVLQAELEYAREEKPSEDYKIVPLYTRPAAAVDELIEAYRAVVYEEACLHCGKGEAWTVKCPDGTYLCETWGDSDGQANAEEMAGALNCAYKQGYAAARAALTGEE